MALSVEERNLDQNKIILPGGNADALRDRVYEYLRSEMEKGNLPPGAFIKVKAVCEKLRISKTPLRDALLRLEAEGLVTFHPRSGISISRLEIEDIRFLFETIGACECVLIDTVFHRFDASHHALLERLNFEMKSAIQRGDYIAYRKPHWDFHELFVELGGNEVARRIVTPIKLRLWDFPRRRYHQQWEMMACEEHEMMTKAIIEKNKTEAIRVIKELHWNFSYNEPYIRWVYYSEG
jgi:DNA-binding GntR family transcriptional regulator